MNTNSADRNGFRKGETTFRCNCCTRLTRHTGAQSVGSRSCPECYELAGIYNEIQDGATASAYADTIRALTATIVERGGKLDSDARGLLQELSEQCVCGCSINQHEQPRDREPCTNCKCGGFSSLLSSSTDLPR
jgi:hypothetical protein